MKIKVPKRFELYGRTINVKFKKEAGYNGRSYLSEGLITLNPEQTPEELTETFLHEAVHHILYQIAPIKEKYKKLYLDETVVETTSKLMYQMLKSSKGILK
jgi:predicted SprT family Zn-dependent metalloprotease